MSLDFRTAGRIALAVSPHLSYSLTFEKQGNWRKLKVEMNEKWEVPKMYCPLLKILELSQKSLSLLFRQKKFGFSLFSSRVAKQPCLKKEKHTLFGIE